MTDIVGSGYIKIIQHGRGGLSADALLDINYKLDGQKIVEKWIPSGGSIDIEWSDGIDWSDGKILGE